MFPSASWTFQIDICKYHTSIYLYYYKIIIIFFLLESSLAECSSSLSGTQKATTNEWNQCKLHTATELSARFQKSSQQAPYETLPTHSTCGLLREGIALQASLRAFQGQRWSHLPAQSARIVAAAGQLLTSLSLFEVHVGVRPVCSEQKSISLYFVLSQTLTFY